MVTEIHKISTDKQRQFDLEFAAQAVTYLEKKGFGVEEVIQCLVDEFEIDRDTARALASVAA